MNGSAELIFFSIFYIPLNSSHRSCQSIVSYKCNRISTSILSRILNLLKILLSHFAFSFSCRQLVH